MQEGLIQQAQSPPRPCTTRNWLLFITCLFGTASLIVVVLHYTDGPTTASISGGRCTCDDFTCKLQGRAVQCGTIGRERRCCFEPGLGFSEGVSGCSADGLTCYHPIISSRLTGLLVGCFLVAWSVGLCCSVDVCCRNHRGRVLGYIQQQPPELSMQPLQMQQQQQQPYQQPMQPY